MTLTRTDQAQWFDGQTLGDLVPLLSADCPLVMERDLVPLPECHGHAGANLVLAVSTETAMRLSVAHAFVSVVAARAGLSLQTRQDAEAALQEALGNAVLHGNLGMSSLLRQTQDGLLTFAQQLHDRLADPVLARRPIVIDARWGAARLEIGVRDVGDGFDPASWEKGPSLPGAASGRGLDMIASLCDDISFADRGRAIRMTFRAKG